MGVDLDAMRAERAVPFDAEIGRPASELRAMGATLIVLFVRHTLATGEVSG